MQSHFLRFTVFMISLIFLVVVSGCGSQTDRLRNALPDATSTTVSQPAAQDSAAPAAPSPAATTQPTPNPSPTATPTATPVADAVVKNVGFAQDGSQVGFAFLIENPNAGHAFEDTRYQLAAYSSETVVATDSGSLPLIGPERTVGVGGDLYLDSEAEIDRIEVQLAQGDAVAATADELPPFQAENLSFYESVVSQKVSGVVRNPYDVALDELYVGIVLFDETDTIIGGGFTFVPFVLASGASAFDTSVTTSAPPARIEAYPVLSNLSVWQERDAANVPPLTLVEQGWGQDGSQVGFGFIVENPLTDQALERSQYLAVAFADDGSVLDADSGYISLLLPSQRIGWGGDLYVPDETIVARVEVQVYPGVATASEALPEFTGANATYQAGQFSDRVTGQIANPYDADVTDIRASAIVRDAAGTIVGGGFTFVDFVPAAGTAAVEVSVTAGGDVAVAELYAALSALSDIGDE